MIFIWWIRDIVLSFSAICILIGLFTGAGLFWFPYVTGCLGTFLISGLPCGSCIRGVCKQKKKACFLNSMATDKNIYFSLETYLCFKSEVGSLTCDFQLSIFNDIQGFSNDGKGRMSHLGLFFICL